jgi:hypothetical protein
MNATIEKQKAQKEGQDVLHLTLIKPLRVHRGSRHLIHVWNEVLKWSWVIEVVDNVHKKQRHSMANIINGKD